MQNHGHATLRYPAVGIETSLFSGFVFRPNLLDPGQPVTNRRREPAQSFPIPPHIEQSNDSVRHPRRPMPHNMPLAVAVVQVQRDRRIRPGRGAADLGQRKLDTAGNVDPNAMRAAAMWGLNRATGRIQHIADGDCGRALFHVHFEIYRQMQRFMDILTHRPEHEPMGGHFFSLFTVEYFLQRFSLGFGGAGVDDQLHLAATLEDRTGPGVDQSGFRAT